MTPEQYLRARMYLAFRSRAAGVPYCPTPAEVTLYEWMFAHARAAREEAKR